MNNEMDRIVLIGYMGSGKTVIGRATARLLDYDFADVDEEIVAVTGLTLPQLFRKHGEIRFRSEETLVIRKLAARRHLVVACGGSLPPQQAELELLAQNGFFVLLTAVPEILLERLSRKGNRLLVGGRPSAAVIRELLAQQKQALGERPALIVDSGALSVEEAAEQIAAAYRERQREG